MRKNISKKCVVLVMTFLMLFGTMPTNVFAESAQNAPGDGNAAVQAAEQSVTEEKASEEVAENAAEVSEEKSEEVKSEASEEKSEEKPEINAEVKKVMSDHDFASKRLIVAGKESIFEKEDPIISSYEGVYLLQFETEEEAAGAYARLDKKADFIDVDKVISVAEGDSKGMPADEMTSDDNPFAELKDAMKGQKHTYDVAVIDTGANSGATSVSMLGDNGSDDNGHGQKMIDFIKAQHKDAKILSIKAIGKNGTGDMSSVYAALQYAMSQDVGIINLSISAPRTSDSSLVEAAIKEASDKGIVVVGAAGNQGKNAKYYIPGCVDKAVIAGSCNENGEYITISNFGDTVDYKVVSDATSEAAAKLTGLISAYGTDQIDSQEGVFSTKESAPSNEKPAPSNEEPSTPSETPENNPMMDYDEVYSTQLPSVMRVWDSGVKVYGHKDGWAGGGYSQSRKTNFTSDDLGERYVICVQPDRPTPALIFFAF